MPKRTFSRKRTAGFTADKDKAPEKEKPRIRLVPLAPHVFQTAQQFIELPVEPHILMTPEVCSDIQVLIQLAGTDELSWLGTVKELQPCFYLVDKIYMIGQEVASWTTTMTEDGLGELFTALAEEDFDACERMHFWGHVHPGDSTSPSQQDEDQMKLFDHNDWFIRAIFGRNGRAEFTFFDYANGLRWNDVTWRMYHPATKARLEFWQEQVKAKATKPAPRYTPAYQYGDVWDPTTNSFVRRTPTVVSGGYNPPAGGGATVITGRSWAERADDDEDDEGIGSRVIKTAATLREAAEMAGNTADSSPGIHRVHVTDAVTPLNGTPPAAGVKIPQVIIPGETAPAASAPAKPAGGLMGKLFGSKPAEPSQAPPPASTTPPAQEEQDETGGLGHD